MNGFFFFVGRDDDGSSRRGDCWNWNRSRLSLSEEAKGPKKAPKWRKQDGKNVTENEGEGAKDATLLSGDDDEGDDDD